MVTLRSGLARRVAQSVSLPAPVGGINLIDSLASMPETDALVLENYIARGTSVEIRRGFASHSTGLGSSVESIMPYNAAASSALFAAAGTSFFNVTSAGAVGAAVQTGLTNARWESINVATSGGQFLEAVNGTDSPRIWDGTTWQTITGVSAPIAITGVSTSSLSHILLHQNRVWFLQANTLITWYLGINSVGGAATAFDLRTVAKLGGSVIEFNTWTIDTGAGPDDALVFITTEGEVIVYVGTDPASVNTWQLQGIYRTGRPTSKRCSLKLRGDLLILHEGGISALSSLIQSGQERQSFLTYKIQPELSQQLKLNFQNFGWKVFHFHPESLGILNVPESGTVTRQYVWDTITQAWCRWKGIFALSMEMFGGVAYLGQSGVVSKLWTVANDNGASITGFIKPAFSRYGYPERKNQRRTRIYFTSNIGAIKFGLKINRDFEDMLPVSPGLTSPVGGTDVWDTALWDTGFWGGAVASGLTEIATSVIGTYLTPNIITESKDLDIRVNGFDHVFEPAGFT